MDYKWAQSLGIDTWITWNNLPGAFAPQARGHSERIDLVLLPPQPLIAGCVVLLMVNGA
jgi:hypothetical protein